MICEYCHEEDAEVDRTYQQWLCGCCGSWNDLLDDRNEMEPVYRAQDAAHEARYGRMGDDDPYDD